MAQGSLEDAVRVLRDSVGGRWDGTEMDGRDAMVDALKSKLDYSSGQANDVIDALIGAGTLRYHRTALDNDVVDPSEGVAETGALAGAALAGAGIGGATGASQGGAAMAAPLAVAALTGSGFWQVGTDSGDGGSMGEKAPMEGRAGQIDPTS